MHKDNTSGYSLIELIVTIGLISVAIGFTTFGLSVIYNNNVNVYASRIVSDIKLVQTKEMASNDLDYRLMLGHDGNKYTVEIEVKESSEIWSAASTTFKEYDLPRVMVLEKYTGAAFVAIDDVIFDVEGDLTFEFDVSSGKILNDSGAGRYRLTSTSSDKVIEFVATEQNGRVYIDE